MKCKSLFCPCLPRLVIASSNAGAPPCMTYLPRLDDITMQPNNNDIIDSYFTSDWIDQNQCQNRVAPPYLEASRSTTPGDLGHRSQRPPPLPPRRRIPYNTSPYSIPTYTSSQALRMASFEGGNSDRSSDRVEESSRLSSLSSASSPLPPPAYTPEQATLSETSSTKPPSIKQRWSDKFTGMNLQRTNSSVSSTLVDSPAGSEDGDPEDREDPLYKNVTRIAVEGEGAETSADITADGRIDIRL